VDWNDMSRSSSSSPPRTTEVSSLRRPQTVVRDKKVGSSSRQVARPAREDQRTVRPRMAPSRTGASESQRAAPAKLTLEAVGGASGTRPPAFRWLQPP
jgi:hypothetical protein